MNTKSVSLKWLKLNNFKGIQSLSLQFDEHETFIHAKNRGGKTTIFDAFTWLLFGKNSEDDTDFSIKTIDSEGNPMHYLDHEVSAGLVVDGLQIELRKLYKEDWVKKRGSAIEELKGHSTEYFWNDAPITMKEYKQRISEILDEQVFKMVTNPLYFNSLKWEERRKILQQIADNVTDDSVILTDKSFASLIQDMTGMTSKMYKDSLSKKISNLKFEIIQIPARVSEAQRNMPEVGNWAEIELSVSNNEKLKQSIQGQMNDIRKSSEAFNSEYNEAHRRKLALEMELDKVVANRIKEKDNLILSHLSEKNKYETLISELHSKKVSNEKEIERIKSLIEGLNQRNAELRKEYAKINSEELTFSDNEFVCATCNQNLPDDKVANNKEEAIKRHNERKAFIVGQINTEGVSNKKQIEDYEQKISELQSMNYNSQINEYMEKAAYSLNLIEQIKNIQEPPSGMEQELMEQIANFVLPEPAKEQDLSEYIQQISEIDSQIQEAKVLLSKKDDINRVNERIQELKNQERNIAQSIAELQGKQMLLENFEKKKSEMIETAVNSMFSFVKFKLFEYQLNGGETATCVCLINGVPFSDANTESKINSGIDIINTLSKFYKVSAPIFIDNRESVTNLIQTSSQVVNLVVNPNYSTPTIVKP